MNRGSRRAASSRTVSVGSSGSPSVDSSARRATSRRPISPSVAASVSRPPFLEPPGRPVDVRAQHARVELESRPELRQLDEPLQLADLDQIDPIDQAGERSAQCALDLGLRQPVRVEHDEQIARVGHGRPEPDRLDAAQLLEDSASVERDRRLIVAEQVRGGGDPLTERLAHLSPPTSA